MGEQVMELDEQGRLALATALGDTPETAISCDRLRRGFARAFVIGSALHPRAAVMQSQFIPAAPIGFGDDSEVLWRVLARVEGWVEINAPKSVAPGLADLIQAHTGRSYWLRDEIHFRLDTAVAPIPNTNVRRLTLDDVPMMEAATESLGLSGWRFGSAAAQVRDGYIAGAVVEDRLVGVAFTTAISARYGEAGVATLDGYRGRGYSTAAAALICADIQAAGLTPVWSTDVDNTASLQVAAKLGFREVSRRAYILPVDGVSH